MALKRPLLALAAAMLLPLTAAWAQAPRRILRPVDDRATVRLRGNVHPLARPEFDAGAVPGSTPMDRMILVLQLDPQRQAELDQLTADQQDPASPDYHQWLTPEDYGRRFGIADADLNQITGWLTLHGFRIDEVPDGRSTLIFSGTAMQVEDAFHTSLRYYRVNGRLHRANATDPEIPEAFGGVIAGIASLHDFESAPELAASAQPDYSAGATHYLSPADVATIYDINPLWSGSTDGTGRSIAVVARSNINLSDVRAFRSMMGLPANDPAVIVNGTDPGVASGGEQGEATLDVEWAGAVAKKAAVKFVVSASTGNTDGVDLSAQYIVNHNLAPVITTSFGLCEQAAGSAEAQFWNSLWQQAASQGVTSLVATGDNGAAGCDDPSASQASGPLGVNVIASSPYAVAVGGTQFNDASNASQYWSSSNNGSTLGSALTYIPESVWNQSGAAGGSGLWAGSGGASAIYSKPAWQTGTGVPADTHRHVPDVSIAASTHDGFLVYMNGGLYAFGGTSVATPVWAGVMTLVGQHTASNQGNANTTLYALLARQFSGGTAVFHDITSGNNSVPGLTGYTAGTGYDQASGIGSPDAMLLVQHWTDTAAPSGSMTLSLSASSGSAKAGSTATVRATTAISGGFKSAVALSVSGLRTGLTASFSPASVASPGSGSSTLTLTAASTLAAGTYALTITASGGGITRTAAFNLQVTSAAKFQLTLSKSAVTVRRGQATSVTLTATALNGYNSGTALSASGAPSGVQVAFLPATVLGSAAKASTILVTVTPSAKTGPATLSVRGAGGGLSVAVPLVLTVSP